MKSKDYRRTELLYSWPPTETICLRLQSELLENIARFTPERGVTRSLIPRQAVYEWLQRNGVAEPLVSPEPVTAEGEQVSVIVTSE